MQLRSYSLLLALLLAPCCVAPRTLQAQGVPYAASVPKGELPPNILAGMDAFRTGGPDDAVKAWVKGSVLENSNDALTQANNLRDIQSYYGSFQGFELIKVQEISTRVHIGYVVLNLEHGPLFARFTLYRAQGAWVLVSFNFDTDETKILPLSMQ
jgi:hypothetical protein